MSHYIKTHGYAARQVRTSPVDMQGNRAAKSPQYGPALPVAGKTSVACSRGKHSGCTMTSCSCQCHPDVVAVKDSVRLLTKYSVWLDSKTGVRLPPITIEAVSAVEAVANVLASRKNPEMWDAIKVTPYNHTNLAKDSLLTNSLALFGLYAIWKALSAPSRFAMPEGSGYKAAMELKGQGWDEEGTNELQMWVKKGVRGEGYWYAIKRGTFEDCQRAAKELVKEYGDPNGVRIITVH